jgi:hypothetical protein
MSRSGENLQCSRANGDDRKKTDCLEIDSFRKGSGTSGLLRFLGESERLRN